MITITTKAAGTMKTRLAVLTRRYEKAAEDTVVTTAERMLEIAKPLVPVETGTLKASGRVLYGGDGFKRWAAAGFGGVDIDPVYYKTTRNRDVYRKASEYAVHVHARVDLKHKVGRAKFLSFARDRMVFEFRSIAIRFFKRKGP